LVRYCFNENKNDFLTVGVILSDNFSSFIIFVHFLVIVWLSEVLGKSQNPIRLTQDGRQLEIMTQV